MTTFVLVHGGWGGGWEWRLVADRLHARGHVVHRPTLTGLGEKRHLARPDVDLDTHIRDVINLIEYEDLRDVILTGQSYGGAVVTGVADRIAERVRRLVYVDAFAPQDGQSVNDLSPPRFVEHMRAMARESGQEWLVPLPFGDGELGLPAELEAWYAPKLCPHPLATLDQPLRLTGAVDDVPRSYVDCAPDDVERWVFARFAQRAREEGWDYRRLPVGHDAQVIAPDRLAEMLEELALLR